uniref:Colony stimulating factor 1b (macrophage) n=1 Tax=Electrophorus electricus TaxID=8005 RepID=A0A4W4DXK8_ELEEL
MWIFSVTEKHQSNPTLFMFSILSRHLCILILLYIPLSMMEIPGPCRHSITKDHLLQMKSLIHLSLVCYVKAALPRVLELLSKRFHYAQGSEAALSTLTLQNLILNIYSQHCVPALNEELEEDPVAFERQFTDSPMRALQRAKEVLDLYLELITHTHTVVDWACEAEYSSHGPAAITEPPASTEAALGLGGQPHQSSSKERFYKPGFIVLSVSAGLLLVLGIYCFIDRKVGLLRQLYYYLKKKERKSDKFINISIKNKSFVYRPFHTLF